jgi:HAD superfamily hydrolase (TIGR01484 family)
MYKALITDLDGTAVPISSDGSGLPDSTRLAVKAAQSAGKKITCATGRQWSLVKPVIEKLGIVSPCVIEGGTRIIDPVSQNALWEKSLDDKEATQLLTILQTEAGGQGLLMDSGNTTHRPIRGVHDLPHKLRFVYLLSIPAETAEAISKRVRAESNAAAHYTPSWYGEGLVDIHITHVEATKQHAIEVWQELEGVTKEETIGMGDSGNDVPIFHASGLKIAVGNATQDMKDLADLVTVPVNENPLEVVINGFLLK